MEVNPFSLKLSYISLVFFYGSSMKRVFKDEKTENVDSEFEKGMKSVNEKEEKKLTNELI